MFEISDKNFYEKLCGRKLSDQEFFDAKNSFVWFFDLILRIHKRNNEQSNGNTNKSNQAE